jgi:hypothetical protein
MKDTPQDPQSFDDAFDARCRDVLSQRSVPAPPYTPPSAPAMSTGKKAILAAGAVALLATVSFLWTADEAAPVSAPVSTEAPMNSAPVETTIEVPTEVAPLDVVTPAAQERDVEEVTLEEAGTNTEPVADATKPMTESAEPIESTPVVVEPQPAAAVDVNESETPEVTPEVMEAEASDEVGTEPNRETPVEERTEPTEENAQQPDAEEAPVLTLPITLPAGGGL